MNSRNAFTTRAVTFGMVHPTTRRNIGTRAFPAGTAVYVERTHRTGALQIRVCGTLWTMRVPASAVTAHNLRPTA